MERNFLDDYLYCDAEDFLVLCEENNYDLRDTSLLASRTPTKIFVCGDVYFPIDLDKAIYLEDIIFQDQVFIENATFQQDIIFHRCRFKKQLSIGNVSFRKNLKFIYCKIEDKCEFSSLNIANDFALVRSHLNASCNYNEIKIRGIYSSHGCFLEGFKIGRIPLQITKEVSC